MSVTGHMGWGDDSLSIQDKIYKEHTLYDVLTDNHEELISLAYNREETPIEKKVRSLFEFDEGWSFHVVEQLVYGRILLMDQNMGNCFPAGTKIRLANGYNKNIEDINVLDSVVTAEGNIGSVMEVMCRKHTGIIYNIKVIGHYGIQCTEEHPVLTDKGYINAKDLKSGDTILIPKYLPNNKTKIDTKSLLKRYRRLFAGGKIDKQQNLTHSVGIKKESRYLQHYTKYSVPEEIELSYDFGKIIGLFLAEGSTDRSKVNFHICLDELETLGKYLVDTFEKLFNITPILLQYPETNNLCVRIYGRDWAYLFESICNHLCYNKQLSSDIINSNENFLQGVFDGWKAGDGSDETNTHNIGVTTSKELAYQMYNIATAIGHMPTIRFADPKISHGVKSRQRTWYIETTTQIIDNHNWSRQDDKYVYRKIRSIDIEQYSDYVFNFEVLGDNSYTANGIGVHNCVGASHCELLASKAAHEIYVIGQNEDFYGEDKVNVDSFVPYIPFSYQAGKMLAGSNPRSDGSYGNVQQKASLTIGIVPCSTPGLVGPFPQPSASVCRSFTPSVIKKYTSIASQYLMLNSRRISSFDDLKQAVVIEKTPCQIASGWGFSSTGVDSKYGVNISIHNRSWAHSMQIIGVLNIKGSWFVLVRNQWGDDAHASIGRKLPPGCFLITSDTADKWLRDAYCFTIGELQLKKIMPVFQI